MEQPALELGPVPVNANDTEVQYLIDTKLFQLQELTLSLKSHRNARSSVSKLPNEIFCIIFSLCRDATWSEHGSRSLRWIGVTHVSKQWREIAVNCRAIWTCIPFEYPQWVAEMLKRSQTADLVVEVDSSSPRFDEAALQCLRDVVHNHLSRIGEIRIKGAGASDHIKYVFQDLLSTPAPRLHTLHVLGTLEVSESDLRDSYGLVEKALNDTRSLRDLKLGFTDCWGSRLLMGLTHLTLGFSNSSGLGRPSQTQFFDALRLMPSLQFLRMEGKVLPSFAESVNLPPSANEVVNFSQMKFLQMSNDIAPRLGNFLSRICVPSTINIVLRCHGPINHLDFPIVLSQIHRIYFPSRAKVISTFVGIGLSFFEAHKYIGIELHGGPAKGSKVPEYRIMDECPSVLLSLAWRRRKCLGSQQSEMRQVMVDICRTIPCVNVRSLQLDSIRISPELNASTVMDALGMQPNLVVLHAEGLILDSVIKFLTPRLPEQANQEETPITYPPIIFPCLHLLNVRNSMDFQPEPFPTKALEICLRARLTCGYPLKRLKLSCCSIISTEAMDSLRAIVPNVTWKEHKERST